MHHRLHRLPLFYLLLALFMLVVGAGTLYTLWKLRTAAIDKHLELASMQARLFENYLTHNLGVVELGFGHTDHIDATQLPPEVIKDELTDLLRHSPAIRSLSLLDAQGRVIASSNPRNLGLRPAIVDYLPPANGEPELFRLGVAHEGRDLYASRLATPEHPASPQRRGFIPILRTPSAQAVITPFATLNPDLFLNYFLATLPPDLGMVDVLRYDGSLLFSTDTGESPGMRHEIPPSIDLSQQEFKALEYQHRGEATLTALRASRRYPLVVLVHLRRDRVLAQWAKEARGIGTSIGLSLLLLLLVSLVSRRLILRATRREAEAQRQMRLAARVYENSDEGLMVTDTRNRILLINPAFTRITGYTLDEVMHQNPSVLSSGLYDKEFYGRMWQQIEAGGWSGEIINRHKDGHLIHEWLKVSHLPVRTGDEGMRYVGIFTDLTDKKHSELLLRQLSMAVEQSPSSVIITDLDGTIEYANQTFCSVTGYELDEIIGHNPKILQSGSTPVETYKSLWQALKAGKSWEGDFINQRKDGSRFIEHALIAPLMVDGQSTHYVAVKHDIIEMRTLTENLRQAKEAAEAADRAKSAFIANMSHELRTPLNAMLGQAQQLQRDPQLPEHCRQRVETIHHSGTLLLGLVNDILDIARDEAGRLELFAVDCDLPVILHALVAQYGPLAEERGLSLQFTPPPDLPHHVRLDEKRLRQVIGNLLDNAIKYTQRGDVRLISEVVTSDTNGSEQLRITVADSGIGIPRERLDDLFKPFSQQGDVGYRNQGRSLGLAISHRLITRMGGRLTVQSTLGEGSHFTLQLPLVRLAGESTHSPGAAQQQTKEQTTPPTTRLSEQKRTELLTLVHHGNIMALRQQLAALPQTDDDPLVHQLREAASNLDIKRIRSLLERIGELPSE